MRQLISLLFLDTSMNKLLFTKGQISLPIGIVISGVTLLSSSLGGYYSAQAAINDKIAQATLETTREFGERDKDIQANTTSIDLFEKRMDRFENKLDKVLEVNGVNPKNIK
jgi:hypothetical protein